MDNSEVSALLTLAATVDNRIIDPLVVQGWHDAIGHLDFELARRALALHRAESIAYLVPGHITACAKRIRHDDAIARQRALERSNPGDNFAPAPANLDAMAAAWDDPVEFARQVAIYDAQLLEAGYDPTPRRDGRPFDDFDHHRGEGKDMGIPRGDRD